MIRPIRRFFVAIGSVLLVASATAANLVWDVTPATPGAQDGSGDWNTTNAHWLAGAGANQSWSNSSLDDATFGSGGFAGTVSVTEPITVRSITFAPISLGNYLIIGAPLTLSGAASIATNEDAQIGSPLSGTDGLTKLAAGTLTLSGLSNYSGITHLTAGTLLLRGADDRLPVSTTLHFSGGTAAD